jgi:hypothetical protein
MSADRRGIEVEAALRRHYRDLEPGPAPVGLRVAIDRIPGSVEQSGPAALGRLLGLALGLAALGSVLALAVALFGTTTVGPGVGTTPQGSAVPFDPTLQGPGLGAPFSSALPWFLVLIGAASLFGIALRVAFGSARRAGALLPAAGAVALLAYASYGEFAPIDLHVTGWGPRLNVTEAQMPPGASENLYYVTAAPNQPFAFGVLLIGGTSPPVTVEGLVEQQQWTALWLDDEPNGGMVGPDRPFEPFAMPPFGRAIYLVGRASPCALGRAPAANQYGGSFVYTPVQLNLSVLGWPRVVTLEETPRIVEPITDPCDPSTSTPALIPSPGP